jgi:GNAT superfamily N-acetyltransferase
MDFKYEKDRIFLENQEGECIAEVTFPQISENEVNINHTYVDRSLRGQGIADKLVKELALHMGKQIEILEYKPDFLAYGLELAFLSIFNYFVFFPGQIPVVDYYCTPIRSFQ